MLYITSIEEFRHSICFSPLFWTDSKEEVLRYVFKFRALVQMVNECFAESEEKRLGAVCCCRSAKFVYKLMRAEGLHMDIPTNPWRCTFFYVIHMLSRNMINCINLFVYLYLIPCAFGVEPCKKQYKNEWNIKISILCLSISVRKRYNIILFNGPDAKQKNAPPSYSIKVKHCLKFRKVTALLLLGVTC